MRRWAQLVCLLLSVSFVLAPLGHVHAHVTEAAHEHVNVHGGHDHGVINLHDHHDEHDQDHDRDAAHDHDGSSTRVIDMQLDLSQRNSDQFDLVQWLAVAFVIALVLFQRLPIRVKLPPPRTRTRPPSPYPHALPLLRGPPRSI
jgi:hypothetical protein